MSPMDYYELVMSESKEVWKTMMIMMNGDDDEDDALFEITWGAR